eukprot:scaffold87357_cov18-Tisochrysis_lutea.AAC.1
MQQGMDKQAISGRCATSCLLSWDPGCLVWLVCNSVEPHANSGKCMLDVLRETYLYQLEGKFFLELLLGVPAGCIFNEKYTCPSERSSEHSCLRWPCSIKDMLYKKRMERELMRAKGLLKEAEKPPGEEVSALFPMLFGCMPHCNHVYAI